MPGRILQVSLLLLLSTVAMPAEPDALDWQVARDPQRALTELASQLEQPALPAERRVELVLKAASAAMLLTDPDQALRYLDSATRGMDVALPPRLISKLVVAQANALDLAGQSAKALQLLEPQLRQFERDGDQELLLQALYARGLIHVSQQDFPAAIADLNRAYLLAPAVHPAIAKADIANALGLVSEQREENAEAVRWFREAETYYRQQQLPIGLSMATFGLGRAYMREQDWARAEVLLTESSQLAERLADWQGVAYAEKEMAHIAMHRQDLAAARQHNTRALQLAQETDNPAQRFDLLRQRAEIARMSGDFRAAAEDLQQAARIAEKLGNPLQNAVLEESQARLFEAQGDYRQAFLAFKQFHALREQAMKRNAEQQLVQMRARFDVEREVQVADQLRQENELKQARLDRQVQRTWLWFLVSLLATLSVLFLAFMAYKSRQLRLHLDRLAHTDELTRLPNRRHVLERARAECERARRHETPLSVAVIDLDHFKQINDRHGHAAGDAVLRAFAELCARELRQHDVIGRIGGEEFFAFFPHTTLADAGAVVERLREQTLAMKWPQVPGLGRVSISIGMTQFRSDDADILVTLARADRALYAAKEAGRDRICFHADAVQTA